MREWENVANRSTSLNARVLVLTADSEQELRRGIAKRKFSAEFIRVPPRTWTQWGLANAKRRVLPYPTTIAIAPDGEVVWMSTSKVTSERSDVDKVLDAIEAHANKP